MSKNFFKSLPPLPEPPLILPTPKATESRLQYGGDAMKWRIPDAPVGLQAYYKARQECMQQIRYYGAWRIDYLKATTPKPRKLTAQNLMILEKVYPSERTFVNYNRNRSGSESSFHSNRATRGMCPEIPEGIRSLPVTSERAAAAATCVAGFDRTINVSLTSRPAVVDRQPRVKRQGRSRTVTAERGSAETAPVASSDHIEGSSKSAPAEAAKLPESNTRRRSMAVTTEPSSVTKSSLAKQDHIQRLPVISTHRSREYKPDNRAMLYDKVESGEFGTQSPEFPGAFKLMSSNNSLPKRVRWADNVVGGTCASDSDGFEAIGRSAVLLAAAVLAVN